MHRSTSLDSHWVFAAKGWLKPPGKLGFSQLEWLPACVPGHVHLDLAAAGVIAHPFHELAELGCQWVDDEHWLYERRFEFRKDPELPRRTIHFAGLDTICRLWLNGEEIARHDNMFVPLEVDVTERLEDGENVLRVEFEPAVRAGNERRVRYLEKAGLPMNVERFNERAFVRKAQYMFGWDWGPRLVSAGIWRPVALHEFAARILDVHVSQKHVANGHVELLLHSRCEGEGTVIHAIQDGAVTHFLRDGELLELAAPRLWWPNGLGSAELYTVQSFLLPSGFELPPNPTPHKLAASALDLRTQRVGLRTICLEQDVDQYGESFGFIVNGERLWTVGANWIPDHSFPSVITREQLKRTLRRARDLRMNMLRVWGGGLYESDEFYDLCDELGLLVWQDFPYACSYAPDDEEDCLLVEREATVNVERLRNHPSLAIWCGNNENRTMFDSKWGDESLHPPRYHGERIWEGTLPSVLRTLDAERPYVTSSPLGGEHANADESGDQHNWDVWHGRGDWLHYRDSRGRFVSEFGFAAAPSPAAWDQMRAQPAGVLALTSTDRLARWHDKTGKGTQTFLGYVELHYPRSQNLAEWTYTSQLNQRDALRFGIEHYRRSEFCRGTLIWQLNDCWPVQSWAVIDSTGTCKAAAFELRRLYAPLLLSLQVEGDSALLWGVLDNSEKGVSMRVRLEAHALSGALLEQWTEELELVPGERRIVLRADIGKLPQQVLLRARPLDPEHHDATTWQLLCEPKAAKYEAPAFTASFESGYLLLTSDVLAVDVYLWAEDGNLRFEDNFVTLAAGERVRLRVHGAATQLRARTLLGVHLVHRVDALDGSS